MRLALAVMLLSVAAVGQHTEFYKCVLVGGSSSSDGTSAIDYLCDGKVVALWMVQSGGVPPDFMPNFNVTQPAPSVVVPASKAEPMDLPAIPDPYPPGIGAVLTCTDKRRFLLTSEDGKKHCILFGII